VLLRRQETKVVRGNAAVGTAVPAFLHDEKVATRTVHVVTVIHVHVIAAAGSIDVHHDVRERVGRWEG
jgi:hypothetical protein